MDIVSYSIAKKALNEAKKRGSRIFNVNTKNDLSTIEDPVFRDMAIVLTDEEWNENTSIYYHSDKTWIYIGSFGVGGTPFALNVKHYDAKVSPGASKIVFNWTNPDNELYVRRILFAVTTDITGMKYDEVIAAGHTPVSDAVGTGSAKPDTFTFTSTPGVTYYTKVFTEFDTPENRFSTGVSKIVEAIDSTPPSKITNLKAVQNKDAITLTWNSPTDVDLGGILIKMSDEETPLTRFDGETVFNQKGNTVAITGLDKAKTYYFRGFSYDTYPIANFNEDVTQITEIKMDGTPPEEIEASKEEGHHYVGLRWTEPEDADWVKTIVVKTTTAQATSPNDGEVVKNNTVKNAHATTPFYVTGLENGQAFYFTFFTVDKHDNVSEGTSIEATPIEKTLEEVSNLVATDNDAVTGINLSWIKPSDEDFVGVEIVASSTVSLDGVSRDAAQSNSSITKLGLNAITTHTHSNLVLGSVYQYKLYAKYVIAGVAYYSNGAGISKLVKPSAYTGSISNFNLDYTSTSFSITWDDPSDSDYQETKVVYKIGSQPATETDGVTVGIFTKDAHKTNPLTITGLTKESRVYIRFFVRDKYGNVSAIEANNRDFVLYGVYGFNVNSKSRLVDAVGRTSSDFNQIAPWNLMKRCVVGDGGIVNYYLDDLDSTKKADLTPAVLDGTDGQVMVEIPSFHYLVTNDEIYISMGYKVGYSVFPKTFVGAFESSDVGGKLGSAVDKTPTTNNLTNLRAQATSRGTGWGVINAFVLQAIKMLFIVEYAGFNSQTLIGPGITNETSIQTTGKTKALGNRSGSNVGVSYRGIENLWGNVFEAVDGFVATDVGYYQAVMNFASFVSDSNTGSYAKIGTLPPSPSGFVSGFADNNFFLADETTGNDSEFAGDFHTAKPSGATTYLLNGGSYDEGTKAGLFRIHLGANLFETTSDMTLTQDLGSGKLYEYVVTKTSELSKITSIQVL